MPKLRGGGGGLAHSGISELTECTVFGGGVNPVRPGNFGVPSA